MLTSIRLRNFKAFADTSIELGRLTLLSGLNSSGKSTVMQALALLRQSADLNALSTGSGDNGFVLNGELVELGVGRDVRHEDWVPGERGKGDVELAIRSDKGWLSWSVAYDPEADLLPLVAGPGWAEAAGTGLSGAGFQYLRADRINPAVSYPRSHDAAIRRGFLGARGEHTVNFLRHHQDDDVRPVLRHPDGVAPTLLRQAEAWLGHLCPGVNLSATGIDGTDTVRLAYTFGTAGLSSTNQYRPTNVGFGLTYVLPIIIACLTAGPGSLLLLENPEAHLHPRGQSAMADLVARAVDAGAQAIVESHSDHVLNGLRLAVRHHIIGPDQLRLLYFRSADGAKLIDSPTVGTGGALSHWPDGFFDEWDQALDQLID